ncbi:redox-sensitive transcriptional activator SoxR [Maricaulaceae bacterium EIL42A08]|nr:redox-sensitive transcriptional activator SoxR [Maricaulaceae bacterium EIL42A08]
MTKRIETTLPIGAIAARTGLSVSAIRYYEELGLVTSERSPGGRRRFVRAAIRRLSFILIAQKLGLSLEEISEALSRLPDGRTPTAADWTKISTGIRTRINDQIAALERMRDRLDGCIGCGCLSLEACGLYNPADERGGEGAGPRLVLG